VGSVCGCCWPAAPPPPPRKPLVGTAVSTIGKVTTNRLAIRVVLTEINIWGGRLHSATTGDTLRFEHVTEQRRILAKHNLLQTVEESEPLFDQLPTFIPYSLPPQAPGYIVRKKTSCPFYKVTWESPQASPLTLTHSPCSSRTTNRILFSLNSVRTSYFISSRHPLKWKQLRQLSRYSNRLWTTWPTTPASILSSSNRLISSPNVQTGYGKHLTSYSIGKGVKLPKCEASHSIL
jgi:hypothetical protein